MTRGAFPTAHNGIEILSKSTRMYWAFCQSCGWNSRQAQTMHDPGILSAMQAHSEGQQHRLLVSEVTR